MKRFVLILITILISMDFALGTGYLASFPQTGIVGSAYAAITPQVGGAYLPPGAPIPPDPNGERLVLPDYNLLKPGSVQVVYPPQSFYGNYQGVYPQQWIVPPVQGCANCRAQDCMGCNDLTMCSGSFAPGCQAIYPNPAIYRCNGYYVQIRPGSLCTEAGIRCGEFLPLWSKIGRDGMYWSYEWAQCGSSYCYPEVRNFGYKRMGCYQTLFTSHRPGWHIISYWCNDWSNYIYIYVWPS